MLSFVNESLAGIAKCVFQKCQGEKERCAKKIRQGFGGIWVRVFILLVDELGVMPVKVTKHWRNFNREHITTSSVSLDMLFWQFLI